MARLTVATRARARAKTAARGYGGDHQAARARWAPVVSAGSAYCHAATCLMPTRWIRPGTPWDLGHAPDRSDWTGPEHRRCNRSDGARRGNQMRGRRLTVRAAAAPLLRTSRRW